MEQIVEQVKAWTLKIEYAAKVLNWLAGAIGNIPSYKKFMEEKERTTTNR